MAAWPEFYSTTMKAGAANWEPRFGIVAIQRELNFHGLTVPQDGIYGRKTARAVKKFQESRKRPLEADGVVGPATGRRLFRRRVNEMAQVRGVPFRWLHGLFNHESMYDPGARGWSDPRDRGLGQINSRWHPDVSDEEAYNQTFVVLWVAERLRTGAERYDSCKHDVDAFQLAIAHHHRPVDAQAWCETGEPTQRVADYTARVWAAGAAI